MMYTYRSTNERTTKPEIIAFQGSCEWDHGTRVRPSSTCASFSLLSHSARPHPNNKTMGGCRITPLTALFVLSGFIMLASHRYFLSDSTTRVITRPHRKMGTRCSQGNFIDGHAPRKHVAAKPVSEEDPDDDGATSALQLDSPGMHSDEEGER